MATLKDIAEKVGVSVATVSYCINNTKSVKLSTRTKIMQAIEELNYIPNTSARNLKAESSKEIGVIFPNIDDICHSEILKGIISYTEDQDYSLNIAFSYNTPKLECKIIDQFIGKNIAGLIIITCQPENTEYFQNALIRRNIPSVFIEHFPNNIDANFLAFDNYNSCCYLTKKLIENNYRNIVLMTGYSDLFSEFECVRGFCEAHDDLGIPYSSNQTFETSMTKESAFRQTMLRIIDSPPEAIITSSELLAKGIMEALNLAGIKVPDQTCVITLGEECWNETNYLPNIIHTSRTAYTLGKRSIEVLLKNLQSPEFFEKEFMLFTDNIIGSHLKLPPVSKIKPVHIVPKRTLRILATSLPTIFALHAISAEFEKEHHVKIHFDIVGYRDLFEAGIHSCENDDAYDIYLFDVSWLTYLAKKETFTDMSEFMNSNTDFHKYIIRQNLENCCYKGHYYGFPIVGGSHILFYRRDLFENPLLQKQFEAQHNSPLRPPKNWTEFNGIARFFTKEFNPYSPTTYGTSVIGSINEEFTLELLTRLWSFGGGIYDTNGCLQLDTPQNIKGFQNLLESCRYAEKNIFEASIDQSFRAFGSGRTAMLLSFTEYASQINDCVHGDIITKVDYSMLPGKTPANVGWNMGVSKKTKNLDLISKYFSWICDKRVSYYMTILNGQSVITCPYQNHEILKLYPWMELNSEGQNYSKSRIYPCQAKERLVPPYEVETILYNVFKKMYTKELSVADALREGQSTLIRLFT